MSQQGPSSPHLHISFSSCSFTDTAQYSVSALNVKGEASYVATVVVKSKCLPLDILTVIEFFLET